MAEGVLNGQNFVNLNELELLGMPINADFPNSPNSRSNAYTPRSMDALDHVLENCRFSFCPLLQAKLCTRYVSINRLRCRTTGQADCIERERVCV